MFRFRPRVEFGLRHVLSVRLGVDYFRQNGHHIPLEIFGLLSQGSAQIMNSTLGQGVTYHFGLGFLVDSCSSSEDNQSSWGEVFGGEMGSQKRRVQTHFVHEFNLVVVVVFFDASTSPPSSCHQNRVKLHPQGLDPLNCQFVVCLYWLLMLQEDVLVSLGVFFEVHVNHSVLVEDGNDLGAQLPCASDAEDIFHGTVQLMELQNQFITPEELVSIHLQRLLSRPTSQSQTAAEAQSQILRNVLHQVQEGSCPISESSKDADELIEGLVVSESQKRLEANRRKKQERSHLNELLYGNNKNKIKEEESSVSQRLLSMVEHHQFIKNMRQDNELRQKKREEREFREASLRQAKEEVEKKLSEEERVASIEKKKQSIQQNLMKMRQNHQKMLASQQQSRKLYASVRKKKRLYQEMKELDDRKSLEQIEEMARRMKKKIKQSKLDIKELQLHEKEYLEMKGQSKSREKYKSIEEKGQKQYHAPPHSKKLSLFLEEEQQNRNKYLLEKKKLEDKLQKIAQYKSLLKEKYKHKSPPLNISKTVATDRKASLNENFNNHMEHINRIHLGNEYMKQAKLQSRRRAKTEEQYFNPEHSETTEVRVMNQRQKNKTTTLEYIPEIKRKEYVEKKKREEIQKMISAEMSSGDRLQNIKIADERISNEMKRREGEGRARYSTQTSQNTLNLLLGSIKAKINLMNALSK